MGRARWPPRRQRRRRRPAPGTPLVAAGASILDAYTKSYDLVPEVVDAVGEDPDETDAPEPGGSAAPEDVSG